MSDRAARALPALQDKVHWADRWQGCFDGGVTSSSPAADGAVYVGTNAGQICRAMPLSEAPGEVWGEAHFAGIAAVGFHKVRAAPRPPARPPARAWP